MCSWFCGTFCCFLLRYRDSCNPSSSATVNSGNKGSEIHLAGVARDLEEQLTSGHNALTEGDHVTNSQPRPRPAMPRMGISSTEPRDKPLPPMRTTFDGGGNGVSRRGKTVPNLKLNRPTGSSTNSTQNKIEDCPAGDISLHSVSTSILFLLPLYRLCPIGVRFERRRSNIVTQDIYSDEYLHSLHALPMDPRLQYPTTHSYDTSSNPFNSRLRSFHRPYHTCLQKCGFMLPRQHKVLQIPPE